MPGKKGGNVELRILVCECDARALAESLLTNESNESRCGGATTDYHGDHSWSEWASKRSELHTRIITNTRKLGELVRERDAERTRLDGRARRSGS